MIRSLYTSISGLITQEAKQDVITNNLANISTTGYKSDNLIVKNFKDVMIENQDKIVNGKNVKNKIGNLSLGSKVDEVYTDYGQGDIGETGETNDFAISGKGFFTLRKSTGTNQTQNFYSRDGHFHINSKGYLVDDSGDNVLGVNLSTKKTEPIYAGSGSIICSQNGQISINGEKKYNFDISDFTDYNTLKKVGDNLYEGGGGVHSGNDFSIKQKALEKSNVNVTSEFVNMMTTMRKFESNQKIVQSIDETLDKAVNTLGSM